MKVFLGGTCGSNHWREEIVIPGLLERCITMEHIFNPVVAHWQPEDQQREDEAKADPQNILLFVLASVDPSRENVRETSFYSGIEATVSAFVAPDRTVVMIDTTGLDRRTAKGINKAAQDWREIAPEMSIIRDYGLLIDELVERLRKE